MNKTTVIILIFLISFSIVTNAAANNFICKTRQTAGFSYNISTNKWEPKSFINENIYFIRLSSRDDIAYEVTSTKHKILLGECKNDINPIGYIFCTTAYGDFKMNTLNNRFISSYTMGYVDVIEEISVTDEKSKIIHMEIGTCKRIS